MEAILAFFKFIFGPRVPTRDDFINMHSPKTIADVEELHRMYDEMYGASE